jgi:Domain of unknown function (DUF4397)
MKFQSFLSILAVSAIVSLTGCKKDEPVVETPVVENAKVMVIHASPNAPAVDVLVDDAKALSSVPFGVASSYLTVKAGTRNIKVNAAGTSTSVINAPVAVTKDKNYSIFAGDVLGSITPLVFTDDLTAPAAGKAHIRVIHLSPDAPAVDVAVTGGAVLFPNLTFKQGTAFTPVAAGSYNLEIRLKGTTTVALAIPNVVLTAGKIYTVYAKGYAGTPPTGNTNTLSVGTIVNN